MGLAKTALYIICALAAVSQFGRIFTSSTHMSHQNILMVTAHPDDETMFFGPTLRHILNPAKGNNVHLLVLSRGDSEGLGPQREQEMHSVARYLGIPPSNLQIIDDPRLSDSMSVIWDSEVIKKYVASTIEQADIHTVITFDRDGVSGHINHRYVFEGTLQAAMDRSATHTEFSMLTLYSVPLWRKYLFSVDAVFSRIMMLPQVQYTLINGQMDYHHTKTALYLHKSQMAWYRRLWSYFSRYMIVNDLGEINFGRALRSDVFKTQMKDPEFKKRHGKAGKAEKAIGTEGSNFKTSVEKPKPTKNRGITRSKPRFAATTKIASTDDNSYSNNSNNNSKASVSNLGGEK